MLNFVKNMKYRKLDKFLEKDSKNARPVAIVKERENVYSIVWADNKN
ncbi:MAG: hypothetical protein M1544_02845 [Candidatus Marsarchaeota archaeon]|nr:hypothetical protein [Candidatus Marsarchaeota archaeon]